MLNSLACFRHCRPIRGADRAPLLHKPEAGGLVNILYVIATWLFLFVIVSGLTSMAQTSSGNNGGSITPPKRLLITGPVDESNLVTLEGNTRPEANANNDRGPVADDLPLEHMMLQLRRSPQQEEALKVYLDQLQDPASPYFHHWLSAQQIGQRYGVAPADIKAITGWLRSHGFTVNSVYPNKLVIDFSGTAGQVREAFHTEIHNLQVGTEKHIANMSDPKIPAALAPAVAGVVSLHNFMPHPMYKKVRPGVQPGHGMLTIGGGGYNLAAADLETIYNFNPLFTKGISGQGQTIVVVEDGNIFSAADWNTYRSTFGLSAYTSGTLVQSHPTSVANNCSDPGINGADGEATLDIEVASAAAPSATINVASCADTSTNFGGFIALLNMLNATTPPTIVSISYGASETEDGAAFNASINTLYQQAVTEGTSVFVSSGDQLAAVSDRGNAEASHGINVNGWGSTVYNVSVGGTDFSDTFSNANATYWSSTNSSTWGSALSYIPEIPWNNSCASTLIAQFVSGSSTTYGASGFCNSAAASNNGLLNVAGGSGGPSACATGTPTTANVVSGTCAGYPKPSWQTVFGNPADGVRDLPDVSLFAASGIWGHAYTICFSDTSQGGVACTGTPDTWVGIGGTSASSPIMAGVQALINQSTGQKWGNPNPTYYRLAAAEYGAGGSSACNSSTVNPTTNNCIFYDVTMGDIDAPCTGTFNCYTPSGTFGVLSTSNSAYDPAYATKPGWDFAAGIGTINVNNLVTGWSPSSLTPTTTTLVVSPATVAVGTSVTATATISPAPPDGEIVTFNLSGGGITGSATATTTGGSAAVTVPTGSGSSQIPGGSYNVTASYPGDTTFAASTSAGSALNVQDFTVGPNPLAITVSAPGQSGSGTITFGLVGGVTTAPSFTCSGLPSESTCTFVAASATTETVTIGTTAASSLIEGPLGRGNRIFYATLFPALLGLLWPAARRKSRARTMISFVVVLLMLMLWLPACSSSSGGGHHDPGTPVGQTNVTVTATSSTIAHNITVNLNVQ
jgi:subtilase family serine protease